MSVMIEAGFRRVTVYIYIYIYTYTGYFKGSFRTGTGQKLCIGGIAVLHSETRLNCNSETQTELDATGCISIYMGCIYLLLITVFTTQSCQVWDIYIYIYIYLAKTGHGPHFPNYTVKFYVLYTFVVCFVCFCLIA
jgi:hypothetical protein